MLLLLCSYYVLINFNQIFFLMEYRKEDSRAVFIDTNHSPRWHSSYWLRFKVKKQINCSLNTQLTDPGYGLDLSWGQGSSQSQINYVVNSVQKQFQRKPWPWKCCSSFFVGKEESKADRKQGSKKKAITMGTAVTDNLLQRPWLWLRSLHTTAGKQGRERENCQPLLGNNKTREERKEGRMSRKNKITIRNKEYLKRTTYLRLPGTWLNIF